MKYFFTLLIAVVFAMNVTAQEQSVYHRVRVLLDGRDMVALAQTGIDPTEGVFRECAYLETDLSEVEIARVKAAGFTVETLIEDVAAFYRERSAHADKTPINRNPADEFPVPQNWEYGSMGGFYTYDQVLAKLDFMAATWPNLITVRQPINPTNLTLNGNPLWWVKISDNPNENENEPQVLYTSLIHSREGIGVQQMIYFMLYLLENYETNPSVQNIVNNRELYFVPIVNPDGYKYNQQTNPNGGGMWRKNRRNNGDSYGVDLNRNFGYKWGYDNTGSSPYGYDETYRGPAAFSEVETQNLKQFAEEHQFVINLNYHSYSNLLLYPWGYTLTPCPDDDIFSAHAKIMTRDNRYTYGPASSTIYVTNGSSDDYMYGDTQGKNAVFAYTPEVGSDNDGFWPSVNRIIPLCQENMIQNVMAAYLSGSYGKLTDLSEPIIGEKQFYLPFSLQRLGFGDSEGWMVSLVPLDDMITSVGDPVSFGNLAMLQSVLDSIPVTLAPDIQSGDEFKFLLQLDNGDFVTTDTITKIYGHTVTLLNDPCDQMLAWNSSGWGITTSSFVSAPASITDSPNGNYGNNVTNIITLNQPVELPETPYARLSFWAKWDIEAGWDYVQLQIKPTNALQWMALSGKYTKPGTGYQSAGEPVYDGTSGWVKEEVDLTPYAGSAFQLRFILKSDVYVNGDGFYFDDLKLEMLDVETAIGEKTQETAQLLIYPNPVTDVVSLRFLGERSATQQLCITDVQGRLIKMVELAPEIQQITIELNDLKPGLYFVRFHGTTHAPARLIVR